MAKKLLLGTAQWGWTVSRQTAFSLLDAWLDNGERHVDCATNYPINKQPDHFRAAERMLSEYILAHGIHDLRITMKIGSLDNMRTPDVNLAPSFIQMMAEEYKRLLQQNLDCLMLHWDNRDDKHAIADSVNALKQTAADLHLRPGISGIKHPEIYGAVAAQSEIHFDIQLKHNVLHSDISRYMPHLSPKNHHFYAYGINAGGIKLQESPYPDNSTFLARGGNPEQVSVSLDKLRTQLPGFNTRSDRQPLHSMNQLGLIHAGRNPAIFGMVLGASTSTQLVENLDFTNKVDEGVYDDVYYLLQSNQ